MTTRSRRRWLAAAVSTALLVPLVPLAAQPAGAAPVVAAADDAPSHTYRATPGDVASDRYTLTANGTDVFVTKYANRSNNRMAVARFASDDATPTLTVHNDAPVTSVRISPERDYPASAIHVDGNDVTFTMSDGLRYAIVQINGTDPGLTIVNDPTEKASDVPDPSASNVVNVGDYVSDLTGRTDQTAGVTKAIDDLYGDDTKDTLYFPDGTYQYAGLELRNRTKPVTVYVAEGALLKNRIQPTMTAMEPAIGIWDSSNITIEGRGVFDGNGFANYDTSNGGWRHDAATSQHQGGVMIVRSAHVTFDDTLVRDAKQWNWETHTAKDVHLNNIKGLTPYAQPWIDGLDLASGQDVTVDGALTLGNDDTFASGHYNPNDGYTDDPDRTTWDTEDSFGISVNDTLGWSAGAGNGIRLGHQVYGHQMKDYTFTNVNYVGFSAGGNGITVQNQPDSGNRTYPRYESVVVKDSSFDTSAVGTNFSILGKKSADPADRIATVSLENDWFSQEHQSTVQNVTDLTIKDLQVGGAKVTRLTQTALTFGNVVNRHLDFPEDVAPVIAPLDAQQAVVGEALRFTVSASDGDGDATTLAVGDGGLPDGATFDAATGAFRWTPAADQAGTRSVTFVVTDARGASSSATVTITVTDPSAETVEVVPTADTDVQTWGAEEHTNFGDNEHLRTLGFDDAALGALGQKYPGGQTGKDAKISYLTFDLAAYADKIADADSVTAELRLTYLGPTKTALSGTDTLVVAKAEPGWVEGDGKTTPPTRTDTVDGATTWLTKPTIDESTVVDSAPFDVTASAKVGNDATYNASEKPVGTVATTDVTPIVGALGPDEHRLSLAVNETKKYDIVFVSREGAERNPNAQGMAPTLVLTFHHAAPTVRVDSPSAGAKVSGTVPVQVALSGADLQAYNLRIDSAGLQYVWQPKAGTQTFGLDTTTLANGTHTLLATATNTHGQKTTVTAKIVVDNPAAWSATATYTGGQSVTFAGSVWRAQWWTQNQQPGDPNGPWEELASAADGTPLWTASRVFTAGDRAEYQGVVYEAQWWTRNQKPGDPNGPWRKIG